MMLTILDQAAAEARDAWRWYHDRSARAGERFQQGLDSAMQFIEEDPERWPEYLHGTRCFKIKRFPYVVVYRQVENAIQVIAIAHCHRREAYWKDRST